MVISYEKYLKLRSEEETQRVKRLAEQNKWVEGRKADDGIFDGESVMKLARVREEGF